MLRCAGLMTALAALLANIGTAPVLRAPALQLLTAMSAEPAATAEFAARGGVISLVALVCSDAPASQQLPSGGGGKAGGSMCCQAAAVLGRLVEQGPARNAIWAAGGGSLLLPALPSASPLALSGAAHAAVNTMGVILGRHAHCTLLAKVALLLACDVSIAAAQQAVLCFAAVRAAWCEQHVAMLCTTPCHACLRVPLMN